MGISPESILLGPFILSMKTSDYAPHSVLYYPSIEFQSIEWLKKALLFWDHVYRIVPAGYSPNDSNEIKLFIEKGLIIDIPVSEGEKLKAAQAFIRFRNSLEYLPAGLNDQSFDRLNKEKVDYRLYRLLDAIADEFNFKTDKSWYYLPLNIARGYMFSLAQTIAESRHLVRATDSLDIWSVSPYFTEKGNFPFEDVPYKEGSEGVYCSLMIEDVFPKTVSGMSAQTIIDLNIERKDERILFRNRINKLVYRLPKIKSKEQWNDEMSFLLKDFERDKKAYKDSNGFTGKTMYQSALCVGVPAFLTAVGSGIWHDDLNLLPALSIAAVATIANAKLIKQNRNPSYASYLIDIDNKARNIPNIAFNCMHEFIND